LPCAFITPPASGDVAAEQVGAEGLRKNVDRLGLRRRVVALGIDALRPQLVDRQRAVTARDQRIGQAVETVMAPRDRIGQHIPGVAAHLLTRDAHARAQARLQVRDAVPVG
jgi:hypothetical protein